MYYAIDSKKHVYAFISEEGRNAFVWDCVSTDAYAMSRAAALEKMSRYIINRAAHRPVDEFERVCKWAQDAREIEIVGKYASYFE